MWPVGHKAYISAEMSAFRPSSGGFVRHANLWLDKSSSIAIGYVALIHCRWSLSSIVQMELLVFNGYYNANRVKRSDNPLEILEP